MIIEYNSDDWLESYGLLKEYEKEFGTVESIKVKTLYKGFNIGVHVDNIRSRNKKGLISDHRKSMYKELNGWSFTPQEDLFNEGYQELKKYFNDNGHSDVPYNYIVNDYPLGIWVSNLRGNLKRIKDAEVSEKLKEVNFKFNIFEDRFDIGYEHLREYFHQNGHSNVPSTFKIKGYSLGRWVTTQRKKLRNNSHSKEQKLLLKKVNLSTDPLQDQYDYGLMHLKRYYEKNGHSSVPNHYKIDGFNLGIWCASRRRDIKKNIISEERRLDLIKLKFNVKPTTHFDIGYYHLKQYYEKEGHSNVPDKSVFNGYKLGYWVSNRRADKKKNILNNDQLLKLKKVKFIYDILEFRFNEAYKKLMKFYQQNGHSDVNYYYKIDNFSLGRWVARQRKENKRGKLSKSKIQKLKKVKFRF